MIVRIVGATLRDLSYIASNLRPEDLAECSCQFDEWSPTYLAAVSLRDHAYCAEVNGNPEAAFGAGQVRKGYWLAWSWGTRHSWRAVPRITRFVRQVMVPEIYQAGGQRVEARALASNESACRWLRKMGAVECCRLENYGTGGEDFLLFEWTRKRWDVLLQPKAAGPDAAAANAAAGR